MKAYLKHAHHIISWKCVSITFFSVTVEESVRRLTLQDVQSILDGTCTLPLSYRAHSPPLNVNTITQDSDDEESSASQSQVGSRSKYYLDTDNSASYKEQSTSQTDAEISWPPSNSKQGDIKVPVPEKQAVAAHAGDGLPDRGTFREVDDSLYVQVGDSPKDSDDEDDDCQSAALLCASPEHVAMKNLEVQQNRQTQVIS